MCFYINAFLYYEYSVMLLKLISNRHASLWNDNDVLVISGFFILLSVLRLESYIYDLLLCRN